MMKFHTKEKRILAVDPCTKGFGFAILEGPENLIDWGVKEVNGNDKNARCVERIEDLIAYYQPDIIVVEDFTGKGSRRCVRIQDLIRDIARLAEQKRLRARRFSRSSVRESFSQFGASTKNEIATAIGKHFAELAPRVPPFRKCWMSEDYRMSIFDAVALALTFFYFENKRKQISRPPQPSLSAQDSSLRKIHPLAY